MRGAAIANRERKAGLLQLVSRKRAIEAIFSEHGHWALGEMPFRIERARRDACCVKYVGRQNGQVSAVQQCSAGNPDLLEGAALEAATAAAQNDSLQRRIRWVSW